MKKPDFFLVGAPRCGTTALYTYLEQHPEIFMSAIKEPQFFADFLGEHRRICNWSDYLNCFAGADLEKRIGEASVAYLAAPNSAKDIKAFSPEARIIIMLRNPVDVMNSLYHLRRFSNLEDEPSFESALAADEHGRRSYELTYRERVKFSEQVKRFIDIFGRDNIHIIIFDDFKADTALVYRNTLEFLDVRSDCRTSFPVINANRRARSKLLWKAVRQPPQLLRSTIHPLTSQRARSYLGRFLIRLNAVHEKRPPIAPDLKSRLNIEVAPEVEKLSAVIGRDLSAWCQT
jgi:Sulfotransferase domain